MKQVVFAIIIFLFFSNSINGQLEIKAGIYPKGSFTFNSNHSNNPGTELILYFTPGINIGYKTTNLIFKYSLGTGWSQLREVPKKESLHFSLRQYLIKESNRFKWFKRVNIFAELEFTAQKWEYKENNSIVLQSFSNHGISPFLGFDIMIIERLKMEIGYGYRFFKTYNHPDLFFGLVYQIYQK